MLNNYFITEISVIIDKISGYDNLVPIITLVDNSSYCVNPDCQYNGTCVQVTATKLACKCMSGYIGKHCDEGKSNYPLFTRRH